jgi:hypothetical protein
VVPGLDTVNDALDHWRCALAGQHFPDEGVERQAAHWKDFPADDVGSGREARPRAVARVRTARQPVQSLARVLGLAAEGPTCS